MSRCIFIILSAILLECSALAAPSITSVQADGTITWQNDSTNGIVHLETSTNVVGGLWRSVRQEAATNGTTVTHITPADRNDAFYRLDLRESPPDPSLLMHLSFDNDFSSGVVLDISGHGHHGYRYKTNLWPKVTTSLDGSQAGSFNAYADPQYVFGTGDYVAVNNSPELDNLTNGTVMVWARYLPGSYHNSSLVDAGYVDRIGSWSIARQSQMQTSLSIVDPVRNQNRVFLFPDLTASGDTGEWHHYAFTFDGSTIRGYFDGAEFSSLSQTNYPQLTLAGFFIGIGCKPHDGTPQFGDDPYPNNGWLIGNIDDVRIYNRALSGTEMRDYCFTFNTVPPPPPTSFTVRSAASNIVELHWAGVYDKFGIQSYLLYRDKTLISETTNLFYLDTSVVPGQLYSYSVRAKDMGGLVSDGSDVSITNSTSSAVDLVLDDAYGEPWVTLVGDWPTSSSLTGYVGSGYVFDGNVDKGKKSVTYHPLITEAGEYEIFINYVSHTSFAMNVPVDVQSNGGLKTIILNERTGGSQWFSLGRYQLSAETNSFVRIRTTDTTKTVVADAIRFVK